MKKMNFYSNCCKTLFAVVMMLMTINVQAQTCIGGSATVPGANFTLDCAAPGLNQTVSPADVGQDIIARNLANQVWLSSNGGSPISNSVSTGTVNTGGVSSSGLSAYIGKIIKAEIRNPAGTTVLCWGYIKIEDKAAPVITCPANVTLTCIQAAAGNATNLAIVGELSGPGSTSAALNRVSAANATGAGALDGTVTECSKWNQFWSDAVTGTPCTGQTITRTWWAKDEWGNTSATCAQTITIQAPVAPTLGNLTVNTTCTVVTPAVLQDILNNTEAASLNFKVTGFNATCGFDLQPNGTMLLRGTCAGKFTIMRMYKLVNTCTGTFTNETQIINVTDLSLPTVSATYNNYTRETGGTYCWFMNGTMQMTSPKYRTVVNSVTTAFANNSASTPTLIRPLASSTMCGAANISVQLTGVDNSCFPGALTYSTSDSRISISATGLITNKTGQPFMKTAAGANPIFSVTATTACGSSVGHWFQVVLDDNMTPNTVCKVFTTATVDENGFVRVPVSAFENGSSDNCGIERQMVRRMTNPTGDQCTSRTQVAVAETAFTANDPNCWNDYVDFTCADVKDGNIMVALRTVDAAGNYSDCMINVEVIDKTGPTCTNQPQINRICTDVDLSSYKSLFVQPSAFDNCGIVSVSSSDSPELALNCGKGEATRTWTFTDCAGLTTSCTQKLVVAPVYGFTVPKIADETKTCALGTAGIDAILEADRRTIINSATLTTRNGAKTCSAPIVETEYWKYSSSQYCQVYRVRYTIIDKCDPFYDYLNAPIQAGSNCGIMYDPRVGGGYFYGIPNATCTTVTSVPAGSDLLGRTLPGHIVIYERIITINDVTAPTSTVPTAPDACTTYSTPGVAGGTQVLNQGCTWSYYQVLTGADNCGASGTAASDPATVTFMWRVVAKSIPGVTAGTQILTGNTSLVALNNIAFGTYTVCYRVTDLCGNMSQEYCYDISGKDCKAPEVLVHNKIVALGGIAGSATTGMAVLNYADIRNRITDNCSGDLTNDSKIRLEKGGNTTANGPAASATQQVMFTCADLSNGTTPSTYATQRDITVRVWAQDNAGNWNYALSTITLQDNDGICAAGTVAIFGAARTENNTVVNNVTVSSSVNGTAVGTADVSNGTYSITMGAATNVQVRATKNNNEDAAQGVTTFDIAKVSQNVLDIEKFVSPYQMIAADVDKSGEIDATDMLHMRRFILKITPSLPGGNFRFIDKAYTFRNAANPFGEDFPEVVNIASLSANTAANFVAVKLGDVNGSYNALSPRSSRTLSFLANDMNVVAGNEYTVNISADKMDAAAFQGTFSFNGATVKSVKAGNLANMTDGNFGIFANAVTTSWNGKTQDASDVLAITFVANKSGKLSDMLTVNSALTQAVANDAAGNEMNVNLKFNTGKVAGGEFALYQNQPNPVANETTIGFNLPKDGQARLTITAVDGKVVKVLNGTFKAGYNTVIVNKSDLNASGVFYYRLETADHSASKKMVIIE
jgi:hypothetical protein